MSPLPECTLRSWLSSGSCSAANDRRVSVGQPFWSPLFRTLSSVAEVLEEEGEVGTDADVVGSNKYKQIFKLKEVHFLALFALIYVGVEVTLGGRCLGVK